MSSQHQTALLGARHQGLSGAARFTLRLLLLLGGVAIAWLIGAGAAHADGGPSTDAPSVDAAHRTLPGTPHRSADTLRAVPHAVQDTLDRVTVHAPTPVRTAVSQVGNATRPLLDQTTDHLATTLENDATPVTGVIPSASEDHSPAAAQAHPAVRRAQVAHAAARKQPRSSTQRLTAEPVAGVVAASPTQAASPPAETPAPVPPAGPDPSSAPGGSGAAAPFAVHSGSTLAHPAAVPASPNALLDHPSASPALEPGTSPG